MDKSNHLQNTFRKRQKNGEILNTAEFYTCTSSVHLQRLNPSIHGIHIYTILQPQSHKLN